MSSRMNSTEFQLRGVGDPRLALHATSALPAWLWSLDGTRILWGNPVGAKLFGAASGAALCKRTFGPADAHRRQIAQLARKLPAGGAIRLERLRGFGAPLGALVTCGCAWLEFAEAGDGILVAVAEAVSRTLPLLERLQWLVEEIDSPIVAFARDGTFVAASDTARPLFGSCNLSEAGLEQAGKDALMHGRAEITNGIGHVTLQRVGAGGGLGLVALIAAGASATAHPRTSAPTLPQADVCKSAELRVVPPEQSAMPDHGQRCMSAEAPAEFELVDEFAESSAAPAVVADEPPPAPATPPSSAEQPAPDPRRHPLRFMWQMDAETRFSIDSDEFTQLMGMRTAAGFGRLWSEI
ncbi:MAG TPA: PAS domain-containing sensor histidine kinase, partial [Bradyrhizobium sp.]|nr:PAS domain-containing sensor histidine kinase [Bradyrhizobium sp.]